MALQQLLTKRTKDYPIVGVLAETGTIRICPYIAHE